MPALKDPGILATGKLLYAKAATRKNLATDMKVGRKNVFDYSDSTISDGATDARAAILAADGEGPLVLPPGTYAVASNMTLTKKPKLEPGAILKPASGVNIAIQDGYEAHDLQQVFDLSDGGTVTISGQPHITPYHFGAVGDGVTDDYVPLQATLSSTVKKIRLVGGVFATKTGLTSSTVSRTIDLEGGAIRQDENVITQLLYITGNNTTIKNGSITGNGGGTTDLVTFQGASSCHVENLDVTDSSDSGVRFISCDQCTATNMRFSGNHSGSSPTYSGNLQASNSTRMIFNNVICNNTAGKGVSFSGSNDCSLSGLVSTVTPSVPGGEDVGFYISGASRITISNATTTNVNNKISHLATDVTVVNFVGTAVDFRPLYITGAQRVKISNAILSTTNVGGSGDICSIHQHPTGPTSTEDIEFTNCRFESLGTPSSVFSIGASNTGIVFRNCVFLDSGDQTGYTSGGMVVNLSQAEYIKCEFKYSGSGTVPLLLNSAGGFTADGCIFESNVVGHTLIVSTASGATIKRSTVTCNRGVGIQAESTMLIEDSQIVCLAGAASNETGIRLSTGSLGSIVRNCTIDAVGGSGIWFSSADAENIIIERCNVRGARSIYITQSTTNKVLDCITSGLVGIDGVVTNLINGTVTPGVHVHKSGNTHLVYGSPEGVVIGAIGDFASRLDGGAGTSFYVKESGTGNTGWVAK